ncbi:MAG: hypothetical protein QOF15_2401, partial [Mycobacterium sp.]|nr:hypothetical protein [Mycobacterium sp.]
PDEDRLVVRMCMSAGRIIKPVAKFGEQCFERGSTAVDITDNVVALHDLIFASGYDIASRIRNELTSTSCTHGYRDS